MDKEIQEAFVDGMNEVYSVMFTDGVNDGVKLYLLDPSTDGGFYKESKVKKYKKPVLLVAKAQTNMKVKGDELVESDIKNLPKFTVPYKSMRDNNIPFQSEIDCDVLKIGFIGFHEAFYVIKSVKPQTFVEDLLLTVLFECEYRKDITSLLVVTDDTEEGGQSVT